MSASKFVNTLLVEGFVALHSVATATLVNKDNVMTWVDTDQNVIINMYCMSGRVIMVNSRTALGTHSWIEEEFNELPVYIEDLLKAANKYLGELA